jgi:hypothetical protein
MSKLKTKRKAKPRRPRPIMLYLPASARKTVHALLSGLRPRGAASNPLPIGKWLPVQAIKLDKNGRLSIRQPRRRNPQGAGRLRGVAYKPIPKGKLPPNTAAWARGLEALIAHMKKRPRRK